MPSSTRCGFTCASRSAGSARRVEGPLWCRTYPRHVTSASVRNRRVSPVAQRPREGPLTEPTAGAPLWPRERVLMPQSCRALGLLGLRGPPLRTPGLMTYGYRSALLNFGRPSRALLRSTCGAGTAMDYCGRAEHSPGRGLAAASRPGPSSSHQGATPWFCCFLGVLRNKNSGNP